MAAHHLTIAKASFAAGLLRPDVTKVSRDNLAKFHAVLEATILKCSPTNVQTCKDWLLENIVPSVARTTVLGKYFVSLSKHLIPAEQSKSHAQSDPVPSLSRRRLHILYIASDTLHHVKYHTSDGTHLSEFAGALRPFLLDLFQSAGRRSTTHRRLRDLLEVWKSERYLSVPALRDLEKSLDGTTGGAAVIGQVAPGAQPALSSTKELPFTMPATHGDLGAPYHDLPAGNLMPHILPNSPEPMKPSRIRALQFTAGPADEGLVSAVKDFLRDVENIDHPGAACEDEGIVADIDELGQFSYRDELGELKGDTYYGWSRAFCEKMKRRDDSGSDRAGRTRLRSSSRSRSTSTRKRRRYSDSSSSASALSSRSRSRNRVSRMSKHAVGGIPGAHRDAAQSQSPSPERPAMPYSGTYQAPSTSTMQIPHPHAPPSTFIASRPPFIPAPPAHNTATFQPPPLGPNGLPVPPPRPPHWNGPWPPPPPPPIGALAPQAPPFPAYLPQGSSFPSGGSGSLSQPPHGRR